MFNNMRLSRVGIPLVLAATVGAAFALAPAANAATKAPANEALRFIVTAYAAPTCASASNPNLLALRTPLLRRALTRRVSVRRSASLVAGLRSNPFVRSVGALQHKLLSGAKLTARERAKLLVRRGSAVKASFAPAVVLIVVAVDVEAAAAAAAAATAGVLLMCAAADGLGDLIGSLMEELEKALADGDEAKAQEIMDKIGEAENAGREGTGTEAGGGGGTQPDTSNGMGADVDGSVAFQH